MGEQPTNSTGNHGTTSVMPARIAGVYCHVGRKDASGDIPVNQARIIRAAMQIEVQPFRNEGKAVVPRGCGQTLSYENTSEKVKQRAELQSRTATFALLPSLLQGRTSIYRVS